MPPAAELAPAGPPDLEALLELLARFNASQGYAYDAAAARFALGELLAKPELGRAYWIRRDGASVGYAVLCFGWSLEWGGRDAFVDEIFVEAPARGRGVGRAALRALIREAERLGVRALHLEVESGNAAGQALYRSEGFAGKDRQILTLRPGPASTQRR
jgi:ribosomal protein S18 acetylase RimI-like enzyme